MNDNFRVIIDKREQRPVLYDKANHSAFPDLSFEFGTLKTGDYSLSGMSDPAKHEHSICIERKSLPDLFQSTGRGRKRFEKEFIRMSKFDFAAVVVEGDLTAIFNNPPPTTQMNPKSVFRTMLAFCQRYDVHLYPCPSRAFAERTIYLLLKRFWDDRLPNGKLWI